MSLNPELVPRWFGPQFQQLHPLLQQLHRTGGQLAGPVDITFGRGIAGFLGRRIARKLGIPTTNRPHHLEVRISHSATELIWERRFDQGSCLVSRFEPQGCWPDGWWTETSGRLALQLTVVIEDGGWRWQLQHMRFGPLPIPRLLLPRTRASKRIEADRYRFVVEFSWPIFGPILSYSGLLAAQTTDAARTNPLATSGPAN